MKLHTILLILLAASSTFSYNALHDAQYQLYPEKFKSNQSKIYAGAITPFNGDLMIPVGVKLGISNVVEAGVRLNLRGHDDYFSRLRLQLDLGFGVQVRKNDHAQADILIGLGDDKSNGAALTYNMKRWVTKTFTTLYQIKLGFFDGLTGGDLCHTELGLYPNLKISNQIDLRASFNWSSALSDNLVKKSAFDFAPGFRFNFKRHTTIDFDVGFGIAGNNKEPEMRFSLGIINDF